MLFERLKQIMIQEQYNSCFTQQLLFAMILDKKDLPHSLLDNLLFQQLRTIIASNRTSLENNQITQTYHSNLQSLQYQNFVFNQYQMIAKQTEFLQKIKQQIARKKSSSNHQILFCGSNPNSIDILPIENSFDMSNISSVQGFDDQPFKTKFGEQFQKSLLASALNEVQQSCSSETYESIKSCVVNTKQKEFQALSQKYEKLLRKYQQLETSFIIKSSQLSQNQTQLREIQLKVQQFEEEKKKLKAKANQLSEKEKRIYKLQTTIVFKEKLFHEGKKRYERQKKLFLSIQQRLTKLYKEMEAIWQQILNKMEQASSLGCQLSCEGTTQLGTCWKKDVMKKCRQQLIDQRNLLKQEEEEIQKEFEMIQMLSDQVKKLINQKEPTVDSFNSEPSSLVFTPSK